MYPHTFRGSPPLCRLLLIRQAARPKHVVSRSSLSLSLPLSPPFFFFLSLSFLGCGCVCLCSTYIQRAHIHVVLWMGTERDWNEWKGVKEESTRVLHRAREQRPASTQLLGPHPHHCQCQILGALLIPSVPNNAIKKVKIKIRSMASVLPSEYKGSCMCKFYPNTTLLYY